MLSRLHIRNFALIESIDLNFSNGFTVFTGETGSGKSIILGALNLILGERADYSVIRDSQKKTVAEAVFEIKELDLQSFFEENDLDYSDEVVVRREIAAGGKSRAFINDTPVQLSILNQLVSQLIKIHSQYHTYTLKSRKFQMDLVDGLIGLNLKSYQEKFKSWKQLKIKIRELEDQLNQSAKEADYIQFQIEELNSLRLNENNFEALEKQLEQLENATEIIQQFALVNSAVEGEYGVLSPLTALKSQLAKVAALHPKFEEFESRIQSLIIELKDINEEATDVAASVSVDEERQTIISSQLDFYNRQLKKHQAASQAELEKILEQFLSESFSSERLEQELGSLKKEYEKLTLELNQLAENIHQDRLSGKPVIEFQVEELLEQLKLPGSKIIININKLEELSESGCSEIELLFTSNKGSEPKPIEKAASGGELSRLMLSLERLLSVKKKLPTLILDEIDTGVSGEVALKMGQMLGEMGKNMQLFSITHLPQVAARGQHQFKVYKTEENGVTKTFVKELTHEERLNEIAGLMSGDRISDAAIENAKILMQ